LPDSIGVPMLYQVQGLLQSLNFLCVNSYGYERPDSEQTSPEDQCSRNFPRLPRTKIHKAAIAQLLHVMYVCKKERRSASRAVQFRSALHKESLVNTSRADLLTRLMIFGLLAVATSVTGCQRADFASVQGIVTLDGKPLADIEVQFLPVPNQRTNHPSTSVYTDADGKYSIVASSGYGVLIGTHHVCLNDAMVMMPTSSAGQEDGTLASEGKARTAKRKAEYLRSTAIRWVHRSGTSKSNRKALHKTLRWYQTSTARPTIRKHCSGTLFCTDTFV
jgi:hypothetical protein